MEDKIIALLDEVRVEIDEMNEMELLGEIVMIKLTLEQLVEDKKWIEGTKQYIRLIAIMEKCSE